MQIFKLTTNEKLGGLYVESTDAALREAMTAYIRAKRESGVPLRQIIYCWTRIQVTRRLP